MTPFAHLISEFAAATGLELAADEHESCTLVSDRLALTIQHRRETDEVLLFAPVAEADGGGAFPTAVLRRALELAFDGRGTVGAFLGLAGEELAMSVSLPFGGLDAATLAVRVMAFADAAGGVAAELEAAAGAPESAGDASAVPPAADLLRV